VYSFRNILIPMFLLPLAAACSPGSDNDISSYTVTKKNFENSIRIPGFVDAVNVTSVVCPRGVDGTVEWLVEEGTVVEEGDVICVIDYPVLETNYDQYLTGLEQAKTTLQRTIADLNMQYAILEAQVRSTEAESELARLDSLELLYSPANQRKVRELQLEISLINKTRYEKKLEALKIIQSSEIRRREIELRQFTSRVEAAREQLDKLTVRAPKAGVVVLAASWSSGGAKLKLGDNVWNNHPIATIPEFSRMKVKMMVSEADFRQISMNDSIAYRFDAMPGNAGYGKIIHRGLMGQPVARGSQVKQFEMEGSIDSVQMRPDPGFTADCNIILKEVEDVIVVPQVAVFDSDSIKVVYVRRGRGYEMRQVRTGLTSAKEAIIDKGLEEGEIIALTRPSEKAVRRSALLPAEKTPAVGIDSIATPRWIYSPAIFTPNREEKI
jgi:multidrug efflux pump subunit AcrA (membrane-fusion protein)